MDIVDLDKQALEIARKRLLENVSFRELGRLYYAAPSTIHRRLAKWLKENRFELNDKFGHKKSAFIRSRDDELSEILARKTEIWRARIVHISGAESAYTTQYLEKPESEDAQLAFRASDELHQCLGEAAAELILSSLRKNMTIGISSGRGVGFAVESLGDLASRTPSWASGYESIRLVSLCGGVHIGKWGRSNTNNRDFDADENVFALSTILKVPRNNITYMTAPISMESKTQQPDTGHSLNLDMAVIGLGQLNTQHHYFRDSNELQLKTMAEPVRKIIQWQTKNPDFYNGLAEIVLRLYFVGKGDLPKEFADTLREANNTIHSVAPEKIKNAEELILIAGGRQKVEALYGVLTGDCPGVPIDKRNVTLVTDAWTAQTILEKISEKAKTHR